MTITEEFKRLYPHTVSKDMQKDFDTYGISKMIEFLENESFQKAKKFKDYLTNHIGYQANTLHLRKGGEIIL